MSLCTGQHCLRINPLGTVNDQGCHFRRTAAWARTDLASQVAALQALLQDASHALCDMSRRTALPANAGTVVRRTGLRGLTAPCNSGGVRCTEHPEHQFDWEHGGQVVQRDWHPSEQ
jgi:hypothetical protein